MDQPCYKCGQPVEQGRPFCPSCAAPQIRVLIPEPVVAMSSAQTSTAADYLPAPRTALELPGSRARALKACVLAVLVASVLMALGLNFFVGMLGVGFVAVFFYRQKLPGMSIKTATGAAL